MTKYIIIAIVALVAYFKFFAASSTATSTASGFGIDQTAFNPNISGPVLGTGQSSGNVSSSYVSSPTLRGPLTFNSATHSLQLPPRMLPIRDASHAILGTYHALTITPRAPVHGINPPIKAGFATVTKTVPHVAVKKPILSKPSPVAPKLNSRTQFSARPNSVSPVVSKLNASRRFGPRPNA